MYCVNCGVKLADTEKKCPLCSTAVYHPDIMRQNVPDNYPPEKYPDPDARSFGFPILATAVFLLPLLIVLACDLRFNYTVTWSGYVIGALLLGYVILILPAWFRKPNPVIFVPCGFAALCVYLMYINFKIDGKWFLTFAFPVVGGIGIITTILTALLHYLKKGKLYIFGGANIATGLFMPLMEFLLYYTFHTPTFVGWSFYPLIGFVLIGGMLIFLALCRPAREYMERKFFI